jgi:hypothetical protein
MVSSTQGIDVINIKRNHGFSLMSILIGLLISLIVISGSLLAFKGSLHQIVPAATDADDDGQRMSGLLRASRLIQGAGFGMTTPILGADLRVFSAATLSGSTLSGTDQTGSPAAGNAIIWRQDATLGNCAVTANCECYGLFSHATNGGFQLLSMTSCTGWPLPAWNSEPLTNDDNPVQITVTNVACNPYGMATSQLSAAAGIRTVVFSTTMNTQSSGSGIPVTHTSCLANFQ